MIQSKFNVIISLFIIFLLHFSTLINILFNNNTTTYLTINRLSITILINSIIIHYTEDPPMTEQEKVPASELERQIFEVEEVRVIIRAPRSRIFPPYYYQRKSSSSTSVSDWLESRIKPLLGDVQVDVIKGDGTTPHGRTNMETLRNSYAK